MFPHYAFIAAFDDMFKERTEEDFFKRLKMRIFGETIFSPLGEDRDPGVIDHLFGPLMDVPIVYEILGEIALNKKRSGGTIYDPNFEHDYIRTPLGGFINHSENPNCELVDKDDDYHYKTIKTIKKIEAGKELTLKYSLYPICDYL